MVGSGLIVIRHQWRWRIGQQVAAEYLADGYVREKQVARQNVIETNIQPRLNRFGQLTPRERIDRRCQSEARGLAGQSLDRMAACIVGSRPVDVLIQVAGENERTARVGGQKPSRKKVG